MVMVSLGWDSIDDLNTSRTISLCFIVINFCFWKAMKEAMTVDSSKDRFLIDGFPRNQNNLDGWKKQMSDKTVVQFVLHFECTEEVS